MHCRGKAPDKVRVHQKPGSGEAALQPGAQGVSMLEAGSKSFSCNVSLAPSTDKTSVPIVAGKKYFNRPRSIFAEQAKRIYLELRGNKLIIGTL